MMLLVFLVVTLAICGYAMLRGGGPERAMAAIFLAGLVASMAVSIAEPDRAGFQPGIFFVDAGMLGAMTFVLFRARRYWPIAVTAMQLLSVMGHLIKLLDPNVVAVLYWLTNAFWAVPQLAILLIATIRHVRRKQREGSDPDWTTRTGSTPT